MNRFPILFSILFLGCMTINPLDYKQVNDITFGTPVVQGSTLHIPVNLRNGQGFMEPVQYLCDVWSDVNGETIAFSMLSCSSMRFIGKKRPRLSKPRLSIPYTGPITYTMVYVGPKGKKTTVGQIDVQP